MIRLSDPPNLWIQFSCKLQRQGRHIRVLWRAELLLCSRKPPSLPRNEMLPSMRSALHRTPQLRYFPKATEWTRNGAKNLTQLPGSIPCLPWAQNHALFTQNTEVVALLNNVSFLIHFSLALLSTVLPEVLLSLLKLHVFCRPNGSMAVAGQIWAHWGCLCQQTLTHRWDIRSYFSLFRSSSCILQWTWGLWVHAPGDRRLSGKDDTLLISVCNKGSLKIESRSNTGGNSYRRSYLLHWNKRKVPSDWHLPLAGSAPWGFWAGEIFYSTKIGQAVTSAVIT